MKSIEEEAKELSDSLFMGQKIKSIRKMKGLSQDDLAKGVNLTRTSIVNIEKGRQSLTGKNIISICNFLKVKPSDIFPDSENSIDILTAHTIAKLKEERDTWKGKYIELSNLLSKIKDHAHF